MQKFPFAVKQSIQCAIVDIEKVRCNMNAEFTERLADIESFDDGRLWKRRRDFEKKWRDPDAVYIDVQRREEERKKQGLPPRLGVLPHSAAPEEGPGMPNKSGKENMLRTEGSRARERTCSRN